MNGYVKGLFRPISNRYYNPKYHRRNFILSNITTAAIFVLAAFAVTPWYLFGLLFIPLDYFVFDKLGDKLRWKAYEERFYSNEVHELTDAEKAMKQYEKDPTPENLAKLQQKIQKN